VTTPPKALATPQRTDPRSRHRFKRHNDLLDAPVGGGDRDRWAISSILDLFPTLPNWPDAKQYGKRSCSTAGGGSILEWLQSHPGDGWQDRWVISGADHGLDWIDTLVAADPRSPHTARSQLMGGLSSLLLCGIIRPSYQFLNAYRANALYAHARNVFRPDLFAQLESRGRQLKVQGRFLNRSLKVITKIVLHTGRDVDHLKAKDVFTFRAWIQRHHADRGDTGQGIALAWVLLREVADLGEYLTLKEAVRHGQRPTTELVDTYQLRCQPVRDVLVRYLDERRPGLDYNTFTNLITVLVGLFWGDIEQHHPDINTLHLPGDVAEAWKQRLRTVTGKDGHSRPRKDQIRSLMLVRCFYRDLQEWALQDPSWARWSVPSPVRKGDTAGAGKAKRKTTAAMHQRVRERLPHLPVLVDTAERHKAEQTAFHAAAAAVEIGQIFQHCGGAYRRTLPKLRAKAEYPDEVTPVQVNDLDSGEILDLDRSEREAFWAWAVIEVLRHTGIRIEELLEITHLALVSYKLPDSGEVVPMLQIVPSKSNEERLLLVSPELASVLASIITRLRLQNGGAVPLTTRYDPNECVTGPPLPHLFQHRRGWAWAVPTDTTIYGWLAGVVAHAGLTDAAGQLLRYTPHDFRRMFATEAVNGGLPVHIVARLLGHKNLNTTQAYMAIFDEQLVRAYRGFLDRRRAVRPEAEYREPTEQEWREFQAHFQTRKLELGECGRPYGTPCHHEHSCIRCPSLRLDPSARPRLIEIIANLKDRIQEAKLNGWLGEVEGLKVSLDAAARKLVSLNRMRDRQPGQVNLGIPIITEGR
jgi:site-specific recombinase XerD